MLFAPPVPTTAKLRSKVSIDPVYVRFINFTGYNVNVFWLDYEGNKKLYNTLGPNDFLDVNTFVSHLWIFENRANGDRLMGEWKFVFYPESCQKEMERARKMDPRFQGNEMAVRRIIPVTYPLYSLRSRALQVVSDYIFNLEDVEKLELPRSVKDDLHILVQRKRCILNHRPNCTQCLHSTVII